MQCIPDSSTPAAVDMIEQNYFAGFHNKIEVVGTRLAAHIHHHLTLAQMHLKPIIQASSFFGCYADCVPECARVLLVGDLAWLPGMLPSVEEELRADLGDLAQVELALQSALNDFSLREPSVTLQRNRHTIKLVTAPQPNAIPWVIEFIPVLRVTSTYPPSLLMLDGRRLQRLAFMRSSIVSSVCRQLLGRLRVHHLDFTQVPLDIISAIESASRHSESNPLISGGPELDFRFALERSLDLLLRAWRSMETSHQLQHVVTGQRIQFPISSSRDHQLLQMYQTELRRERGCLNDVAANLQRKRGKYITDTGRQESLADDLPIRKALRCAHCSTITTYDSDTTPVRLFPCGHTCVCHDCIRNPSFSMSCPLCHTSISQIQYTA